MMLSSLQAKFAALAIALPSLLLVPKLAQASSYRSGSTELQLDDKTAYIQYRTQINGKTWSGEVKPLRVLGHNGNRSIGGTFEDGPGFTLDPMEKDTFCRGDFVATQTVEADRYVLNITWRATDGKNCSTIGQSHRLRLVEALPIANSNGDFFWNNSKVWFGIDMGQNDFHTWDRWQVVDGSGALNCRARPNGKIVKTYRKGNRFNSRYDSRGIASAILGANNSEDHPSILDPAKIKGAPWIFTQDKCFVRANTRFIQPLSKSQDY